MRGVPVLSGPSHGSWSMQPSVLVGRAVPSHRVAFCYGALWQGQAEKPSDAAHPRQVKEGWRGHRDSEPGPLGTPSKEVGLWLLTSFGAREEKKNQR